jgi:hypothetical protein
VRRTLLALVAALLAAVSITGCSSGADADTLHHDATVSRAEFAMLELAGDRVDPEYVASADPNVSAVGGGLYIGIPAGAYLRSVARNGSPAFTLEELRAQAEEVRKIADITLADAIGIEPRAIARPTDAGSCPVFAPEPGQGTGSFPLPPGTTAYGPAGGRPVTVGLRRFAAEQSGVLEEVPAGSWRALDIPRDAAPERWHATIDAPMRVCVQP